MNKDEAKGRVKEAAGDLTDDDELSERARPTAPRARPRRRSTRRRDKVKDTLDRD